MIVNAAREGDVARGGWQDPSTPRTKGDEVSLAELLEMRQVPSVCKSIVADGHLERIFPRATDLKSFFYTS